MPKLDFDATLITLADAREGHVDSARDLLRMADPRAPDAKSARDLVSFARDALANRSDLPRGVRTYLTDALAAVADGESPDVAFKLRRRRGNQYDPSTASRRWTIANHVYRFHMIEGYSVENAAAEAVEWCKENDRALLNYLKHNGKSGGDTAETFKRYYIALKNEIVRFHAET